MADVELVIKIPKSVYNYVKQLGSIPTRDTQCVANAIFDSTPLPKGHGRLIDARELKTTMTCYMMDKNKTHEAKYVMSIAKGIVDLQKTIVEAESEE